MGIHGTGTPRLLPTQKDIERLARLIEAEKRRAEEGRKLETSGRPVRGDDIAPPAKRGAPLRADSVRARLAALQVGGWVDLPSRGNIGVIARLAGVVVRTRLLPSGLYRITRVPADIEPGRWPAEQQARQPWARGTVRARIRTLEVGQWFDCHGRPPAVRKCAHTLAAEVGARVSVTVVGDAYRVTRIPDDAPRGRWPDKPKT